MLHPLTSMSVFHSCRGFSKTNIQVATPFYVPIEVRPSCVIMITMPVVLSHLSILFPTKLAPLRVSCAPSVALQPMYITI